ncbi:hypothetical protein LRP88_10779 [Fusarium phalaenopsidis]
MSTQPGPQQLQLARRIPEIQELDLRDPPGRIATTRERSHTVQYPPHPYPLDKPPIALFYNLNEDWIDASQEVLIFTHQVPESDDEKMRLLDKKSEHFQFYFWTALDRARRFNKPLDGSVRLWKPFDVRNDNGQPRTETVDGEDLITLKRRDPRSGVLESQFVRRWWLVASQVPLRRFENGDAVLPITAEHYEARYGTASMQWNIPSDF